MPSDSELTSFIKQLQNLLAELSQTPTFNQSVQLCIRVRSLWSKLWRVWTLNRPLAQEHIEIVHQLVGQAVDALRTATERGTENTATTQEFLVNTAFRLELIEVLRDDPENGAERVNAMLEKRIAEFKEAA